MSGDDRQAVIKVIGNRSNIPSAFREVLSEGGIVRLAWFVVCHARSKQSVNEYLCADPSGVDRDRPKKKIQYLRQKAEERHKANFK